MEPKSIVVSVMRPDAWELTSAATIAAEIAARHDCGDHSIFVGRIIALRANSKGPLVVHGGRYASLVLTGEAVLGPIVEFW